MPALSGASFRSTTCGFSSPRRPPSVPSAARIATVSWFIAKYPMPNFRALFLAGERADPETLKWAERMLGVPVIDHWWQTETGWPIAANPLGLGCAAGQARLAVACRCPATISRFSMMPAIRSPPGTLGNIVVETAPAACLPADTLECGRAFSTRPISRSFPGYYKTADAGYVDEDGYLFIMSRTDDIINCAGHRLVDGGDGGGLRHASGRCRMRGRRYCSISSRDRCPAASSC